MNRIAKACRLASLCGLFIWLAIPFPVASHAQTLWAGMEGHVRVTPYAEDKVYLTNLDSSPLTAATWDFRCPFQPLTSGGSDSPKIGLGRRTGRFDVALNHGYPLRTGESLHLTRTGDGCSGMITAIIFADGSEFGDPVILRRLHECRAVAKEELDTVLHQDILAVPISTWDPAQSLAKLQARKATFHFPMDMNSTDENTMEMQNCRVFEIENIASGISEFQSSEAADPAYYTPRRSVFLEAMLEKDRLMTSSTYKRSNINWKKPILPLGSETKP